MSKNINNLTDKEIREMGLNAVDIYCENCGYEVKTGLLRDSVFKVNMQGGYYKYDGQGGCETQCPVCKLDKLVTED